jgi:hypothetical protein
LSNIDEIEREALPSKARKGDLRIAEDSQGT